MVLDLYSKTDCKTVHHIRVDAALVSPDTMNYRLAIKGFLTFLLPVYVNVNIDIYIDRYIYIFLYRYIDSFMCDLNDL